MGNIIGNYEINNTTQVEILKVLLYDHVDTCKNITKVNK